jgi:type VI secretion system secreted protein VgrG
VPAVVQPRQLGLETPLGPGALTLVGVSGREELSRLFSFTLDLVAPSTTPVPLDQLVGQPVTVRIGEARSFNGFVSRFSAGARDARNTAYRAELVPRPWLLTHSRGSRVFQDMSVPEIVRQVVGEAGASATFELQGAYPPRNYCVQYRETAFDFVARLMEEEGIWFAFRHSAGAHELVVGDGAALGPDVGTFPFDVQNPKVTHRLRPGGNENLELYDYPGGYASRFDGVDAGGGERPEDLRTLVETRPQVAALRMQEETDRSLVVDGRSTCTVFGAGATFTLSGHGDGDGAYVLTGVAYRASQPAGSTGSNGFAYANTFTGIPAELPFRPARLAQKPVVHGPQTAVVVGPADARTFTDPFGRVKVQFFWDREEQQDEHSSCWIRVSQPAGGAATAFFWLPEVGDEVVVAFLEGDPDEPIIIGRVYNADDAPPDDDQ